MQSALLIRQILVRAVFVIPFVLAWIAAEGLPEIFALCLFAIKLRLPDKTQLYEISTVSRFSAQRISTLSEAEDQYGLLSEAFVFPDEVIDQRDVMFGGGKIKLDLAIDLLEHLAFFVMLSVTVFRFFQG